MYLPLLIILHPDQSWLQVMIIYQNEETNVKVAQNEMKIASYVQKSSLVANGEFHKNF